MNVGDKAAIGSEGNDLLSKRKLGFALTALALATSSACAQVQDLPPDAMQMCTVDQPVFASWFGGTVTTDGAATPADSRIRPITNCDFHQWAERMFLWLTSPGDDGRSRPPTSSAPRVFHSSNFYTVSPPMAQSKRIMTRNTDKDQVVRFAVLTSKPVETGQPGAGYVLMAENLSPVFYESQVNNVYAYFLTAKKTGAITPIPTKFPTTEEELNSIVDFAGRHYGDTLSNKNALIIEVKAAWVEAIELDETRYITMMAQIPAYNRSNEKWTFTGHFRDAKLALVGLHIAGSTNGNPKLVWTTFEHIDNTPWATYYYKNARGDTVKVDPNPGGRWLFSKRGCLPPINKPRMHVVNGDIVALGATESHHETVGPIETCRENAWGTNPVDDVLVDKNTEVISMNNRIRALLPREDVRRNYLMVGTTWDGGFGNSRLADSTLETFEQKRGCNDCHNGELDARLLSHMFPDLQPLPPPPR